MPLLNDDFDHYAYDAAYHTLHTRQYDGSYTETAARITAAACQIHELDGFPGIRQLINSADARKLVVVGMLASVRFEMWQETRPLLDAALTAAAKAMLDGPNAIRYNYPLPADRVA